RLSRCFAERCAPLPSLAVSHRPGGAAERVLAAPELPVEVKHLPPAVAGIYPSAGPCQLLQFLRERRASHVWTLPSVPLRTETARSPGDARDQAATELRHRSPYGHVRESTPPTWLRRPAQDGCSDSAGGAMAPRPAGSQLE